jgi:hypothetical protein
MLRVVWEKINEYFRRDFGGEVKDRAAIVTWKVQGLGL